MRVSSVIHPLFLDPVKWLGPAMEGNGTAWKNRTNDTIHVIGELDQWT